MAAADKTSLLALLAAHYGDLLRYLTRRLGSATTAADVAQDTYLRLRGAATVSDIANPRAYLFQVAGNLATDRLRSDQAHQRRLSHLAQHAERVERRDPEVTLDYKQRITRLAQAIDELPPRCREVFLMHRFDGLSHPDIAARLGISRSMVEKHVMKALAHCRDRLSDPPETPLSPPGGT
ncbi:sigma-70 family RNA polymerase sigma factor [Reyranella sp. CPCC 100927]|uniref:sigma-70 family RNA polymerase sigma factor n=1 Tax=Reyranella sp. CPCC 100927 TaxID=2599616 RepID=UPI0011B72868|nr:sigma-70 family RNA polymerase sigma factor [Reyranella sp. CPCC 100927]TWT03762.1 sigma-70 family RNA polymerase sigma factor [Reyranella sp. CPCC 100927]